MYSLTIKLNNVGKELESTDEIEAFARLVVGDEIVDKVIQDFAHCIKKGWIVNRSRKIIDKNSASFCLFSKSLSNIKAVQDYLENSPNFKSLVSEIQKAGCLITSQFGQEIDEITVYELDTHLVLDWMVE